MNMLNLADQQKARSCVPALRSTALYGCGSSPLFGILHNRGKNHCPEISAPNKSLIDKVSTINTYRAVYSGAQALRSRVLSSAAAAAGLPCDSEAPSPSLGPARLIDEPGPSRDSRRTRT